jgi:hypothetical protein
VPARRRLVESPTSVRIVPEFVRMSGRALQTTSHMA